MTDNVGSFEVRDSGGARVSFWPLAPGTTVTQGTTPPHPIAPGAPNPIVVGTFGIFDIVIAYPAGAPITRTAVTTTGLGTLITGAATNSGTVFANGDVGHICFAVDTGGPTTDFTGSLRINATLSGTATRLDIPIEVRPSTEEDHLFIAFALITTKRNYTWIRLNVVNHNGGAVVGGATARIRALRDNGTVRSFNRIAPALTTTGGFLAHDDVRDIVGVPIDWPIVFEFEATDFVRRAQMLEFTTAQRTGHHNRNAHTPGNVQMTAVTDASLATRHFAFDPGHGVVYAATGQRRSNEWFLAHRIATGVSNLLQTRHSVPAANITFMRTAGLGLIDPGQVDITSAPENGDTRYAYDMTARTVRIVNNALTLTHISNLLLTTHGDVHPFAANAVPVADRDLILTSSPATITAALNRTAAGLTGRTAQPATVRWNETTQRYVFDSIPTPAPDSPPMAPGPPQTHNLAINTTDEFTVTDAMLRNLAARTARWSLNREVSGGAAFKTAARTAMMDQGALAYMTNAVVHEADRPAGDPFLDHGIKGWSFGRRRTQLRGLTPTPNITLTLHHNALGTDGGTGRGNVMLASNTASATAAHLRLQKTFVKYVRGLEQGLRSRGITNTHSSALNGGANAALIPGYAFFENEFMNAASPATGVTFEYQRMVLPAFIDRTVEEIVAAIVEFLIDPQPNAEFDSVDVGVGISAGGVSW